MYLRLQLSLGFVLVAIVLSDVVQYRITTRYEKMRKLQKEVDNFYDGITTDDEIQGQYNKSSLIEMDSLLAQKLNEAERMVAFRKRLGVRIKQIDVGCSRMRSAFKCNNVLLLGLKYSENMAAVYQQLGMIYEFLGLQFSEHLLHNIRQERIVRDRRYSRIVLTFKKSLSKQVLLIKFRVALEEYEKKAGFEIDYKNRKLCLVPHLEDCQIYMQDDVDRGQKLMFSELKDLQRSFPSLFHAYIKDSKIFYKMSYEARPRCLSRMDDIAIIADRLNRASQSNLNLTTNKVFRSGTAFPWDVYEYNRTKPNISQERAWKFYDRKRNNLQI